MLLKNQDISTILAALRFYQAAGLGDPANRADHIHDIATDGGAEISLDDAGIDDLCERLNVAVSVEDAAAMQQALQRLLDCPALNLEGLEKEDEAAIAEGELAIAEMTASTDATATCEMSPS